MKLLGITITRSRTIEQTRQEMRLAASQRLLAELSDSQTNVSKMVARVARSAATDHFQQLQEDNRAKFEADPEFQEWARQRREHDLAEAERAQPAGAVPTAAPGIVMRAMLDDRSQLRYGLLGYINMHGYMTFTTLALAFPGYLESEIRAELELLRADSLIMEEHGGWISTWTQTRPIKEDGGRDENPDPQ